MLLHSGDYNTVDLIHKAKMNGISYYEVSAKNHFELAEKSKRYFKRKNIYPFKQSRYYINLTEQERSQIMHSLIDKKNALMAQGRYTDAVDEVILKLMKAKKKAFIVRTVS